MPPTPPPQNPGSPQNPRNPQDRRSPQSPEAARRAEDPPASCLALCSHTHLFPGVRCRLQGLHRPKAFATAPEPLDLYLRFSDGTAAAAELRTGTATTLTVAAHTTAAGTPLDESTWSVKGMALQQDEVELTIGARSPLPPPGTPG
ncbi:hypothetical protein [Streptomyces sp. NPDC017448]|uniref:hypothetical protein n=1 Tax=Streptomyces sp. NPDC017448 TaxID=3364996 RepID=UPI0037AD8C4D